MHRDEAIYARSDARGGITLTAEEVSVALRWRRTQWESGSFYGYEDERLAARLEAASTTPSP